MQSSWDFQLCSIDHESTWFPYQYWRGGFISIRRSQNISSQRQRKWNKNETNKTIVHKNLSYVEPKYRQPNRAQIHTHGLHKGGFLECIGRSVLYIKTDLVSLGWEASFHSKVLTSPYMKDLPTPLLSTTPLSDQTTVSTPASPPHKWLRPEQDFPSKTVQRKTTAQRDQSVLSMTTFLKRKLSQQKILHPFWKLRKV